MHKNREKTGMRDKTDFLTCLASSKLKRFGVGMHRSMAGTREDTVATGQGQLYMPGSQQEK